MRCSEHHHTTEAVGTQLWQYHLSQSSARCTAHCVFVKLVLGGESALAAAIHRMTDASLSCLKRLFNAVQPPTQDEIYKNSLSRAAGLAPHLMRAMREAHPQQDAVGHQPPHLADQVDCQGLVHHPQGLPQMRHELQAETPGSSIGLPQVH